MRLEGLLFYVFIFIVLPVIRGLLGSGKTKKNWKEKQQTPPKAPLYKRRISLSENTSSESTPGMPPVQRIPPMSSLRPARPVITKKTLGQSKLVDVLSQIAEKSSEMPVSELTTEQGGPLKALSSESWNMKDFGIGEFTGDDLLKGIILKEILDPPKALSGGQR